ncbi:MAG: 50S ribosomal protein L35 [Planctomycetes bacterium]|nr:50S ribosomal protein L35 [Planctomycetota bacterium]MCB9895811.1 50S ribosomal protein L35 [Planctomycetota bacterium]
MPKMKTHKGAAKRFKVTKKGKIKHYNSGRSHLMSAKSPKRRRNKRHAHVLSATHARNVAKLMGVRRQPPAPTPPQSKSE